MVFSLDLCDMVGKDSRDIRTHGAAPASNRSRVPVVFVRETGPVSE